MKKNENPQNRTVKIEKDRLTGLGLDGVETISVPPIVELLETSTKEEIAETLDGLVVALGTIGLHLYHNAGNVNEDPKRILNYITSALPEDGCLFQLQQISKIFKA